MKRTRYLVMIGTAVIVGCAPRPSLYDTTRPLIGDEPVFGKEYPRSYVRVRLPEQQIRDKPVSINAPSISVIEAITKVMPDVNVVPMDSDVDLRRKISVKAHKMRVNEYLEQLTGAAGYAFTLKGRVLQVASVAVKRWNVAALTWKKKGTAVVGQKFTAQQQESVGSSVYTGNQQKNTYVTVESNEDVWDDLLTTAKEILGIQAEGTVSTSEISKLFQEGVQPDVLADKLGSDRAKLPFVVGNRTLGVIAAAGPPQRMQALDDYISGLIEASTLQVNLDVKAFEVTLKDERSRGIDWSIFYKDDDGGPTTISGSAPATILSGGGLWTIDVSGPWKNVTGKIFLEFLGQFGEVSILTQPNVTVTNGSTAYLSSGDEFSFIADIEQTQDLNGNATVSPRFDRMRIGVTLAVTAKVVEDDKIAIEIVPVISSLQGYDNFSVQGFNFKTPRVALQELSTQVITRSGQPVHLGGLITKKIAESVARLPLADPLGKMAKYLLGSENNTLSRRELVITVTPKLIRI